MLYCKLDLVTEPPSLVIKWPLLLNKQFVVRKEIIEVLDVLRRYKYVSVSTLARKTGLSDEHIYRIAARSAKRKLDATPNPGFITYIGIAKAIVPELEVLVI